ncbi:hypothetical protein BBJ28_00022229, partial [Nothophytophthora sp. Chile5]
LPLSLLKTAQGHPMWKRRKRGFDRWIPGVLLWYGDMAIVAGGAEEWRYVQRPSGELRYLDECQSARSHLHIQGDASAALSPCRRGIPTLSDTYTSTVGWLQDGDRFWKMPECYIRGNTIKYIRVPNEVRNAALCDDRELFDSLTRRSCSWQP